MTVELVLPVAIVQRMKVSLNRAKEREIGGVLMARQIAPGKFEIVDFSVDEVTGDREQFVRNTMLHDGVLNDFFERTGRDYSNFNYIGEWHSHPNLPVVPSVTDLTSMENLVNGERDIPIAALLVVRSDDPSEFTATATFHQRATQPVPVRILLTNKRRE